MTIDNTTPPAGLDPEPAKPPTHRYSWSAAQVLMQHLDACVQLPQPTPPEELDERRRVMIGMLEDAWKANPYLTLGSLIDRAVKAAGGADLTRLPDVALIHVLAEMAQPMESF